MNSEFTDPVKQLLEDLSRASESLKKIYKEETQDGSFLSYMIMSRLSAELYFIAEENTPEGTATLERCISILETAWQSDPSEETDVRNLIKSEFATMLLADDEATKRIADLLPAGLQEAVAAVK